MNQFPIRAVSKFSKICGDIRSSRCTTGVVDIGGKFTTCVVDTCGNLPPGVVDSGGKFSTGINDSGDTGGKFTAVVVDTGGTPFTCEYLSEFLKKCEMTIM
jgi:hypothetical protein